MATSRSGTFYLERKRILMPRRHRPKHWYGASKGHRRPVNHLPELMGDDGPQDRVITVAEEERIPYERDCDTCTD